MDCELPSEKKTEAEAEPNWRERAGKIVGRLRNSIVGETAKNSEEQLNWIKARPTLSVIKGLIEESLKEDQLGADEKLLVKYLKEVNAKVDDLTTKIHEISSMNNIKKAKAAWSSALETGVRLYSLF
jgi:hypothetical protein